MPKSAKPAAHLPSADERRRVKRSPSGTGAWIVSPTSTRASDRVRITAINISSRGIAFQSPTTLPTGAYFQIDLSEFGQSSREIKILRCQAAQGDAFEVGAVFC